MDSRLKIEIAVIAAVARNGAIGRDNQLLMHLPGDLPRFKRITNGHAILMGRKTWDSIGRPLPGRRNIVITRNAEWQHANVERAGSVDEALRLAADDGKAGKAFVIGGAEIYAQTLPLATELLLTEIDADLQGDAFFPWWDRLQFEATDVEHHLALDGVAYRYVNYRRTGFDRPAAAAQS